MQKVTANSARLAALLFRSGRRQIVGGGIRINPEKKRRLPNVFIDQKISGCNIADEVVKRVEEGLLPQLKDYSGFIAYYAVDFEDGDLGGVSIYSTKQNADDATAKATEWVREIWPSCCRTNRISCGARC